MFEVFVIPILLYGCETWILTPALLSKLEKLQSEIGKRILKLSKFHADLAPIIGLHLPSIKARIAIQKLRFLTKLLKSEQDDLASRVFRTLSADNVYSISVVEQCRWLLEELGLGWILQKCLSDPTASDTVKDLQNIILKQDWSQSVDSARNHPSLKHIVCSNFVAASWCSHWDRAPDLGTKGTRLFQCLFSSLCRPVFGDRVCPLCEREIPSHQNYFDHLNSDHLNKGYGPEVLRNILENDSQSVLDLASCVLSLYHCQSPS